MQWWNDFLSWLNSDTGWRILSTAIVPFVAILLAGIIAALIGRGSTKRLLEHENRERQAAAVGAIVDAGRLATTWSSIGTGQQQHAESQFSAADIGLRLLPITGASAAADWASHQVNDMRKNSASFSFQADQTFIEYRDRLLEWQRRPGRARKLFALDLERFRYEDSSVDAEKVDQQRKWAAEEAAAAQDEVRPNDSPTPIVTTPVVNAQPSPTTPFAPTPPPSSPDSFAVPTSAYARDAPNVPQASAPVSSPAPASAPAPAPTSSTASTSTASTQASPPASGSFYAARSPQPPIVLPPASTPLPRVFSAPASPSATNNVNGSTAGEPTNENSTPQSATIGSGDGNATIDNSVANADESSSQPTAAYDWRRESADEVTPENVREQSFESVHADEPTRSDADVPSDAEWESDETETEASPVQSSESEESGESSDNDSSDNQEPEREETRSLPLSYFDPVPIRPPFPSAGLSSDSKNN
jgi:hypothetical protein